MTQKDRIQQWWADYPMVYGAVHGQPTYRGHAVDMGTVEFFRRIDQEFYAWTEDLHGARYFDRLFPYNTYAEGARVLEVGCGMGTMAMNWAIAGAQVTAVDLNPLAVEQTARRFVLFGLGGEIRSMDAHALSFANDTFDYVYSWGVLHHSPDLKRSVSELLRVLRPGGGFGLMLYNRHSIRNWYRMQYLERFLHYEGRFLGPLELASRYTDGEEAEGNPYTWPVTEQEIRTLLTGQAEAITCRRLGGELDTLFKRLVLGLGLVLPRLVRTAWARRYGWTLWIAGRKT